MGTSDLIRKAGFQRLRGPNYRGEYSICCPFDHDGKRDTKYRMQLNPSKGLYHCYRCGKGGKADLSWIGAALDVEEVKPEDLDLGPPDSFVPFNEPWSHAIDPYRRYLVDRKLMMQAENVGGGACWRGPYAGRVIIPHFASVAPTSFGYRQPWAGFSARAIYPGMQPKYLYPKGMDRRNSLWGQHLPYTMELFLVEGVFDALALFPAAVASFGKNVTHEQMETLASWGEQRLYDKLVICLDGDAWEECRIIYTRMRLRGLNNVNWCRLPPGTDPGVLGFEVRKYLQEP